MGLDHRLRAKAVWFWSPQRLQEAGGPYPEALKERGPPKPGSGLLAPEWWEDTAAALTLPVWGSMSWPPWKAKAPGH